MCPKKFNLLKLSQCSGIEQYYQDWNTTSKLCALGILNIEKYYDLDPKDIMRGIIEYGGKIYK